MKAMKIKKKNYGVVGNNEKTVKAGKIKILEAK